MEVETGNVRCKVSSSPPSTRTSSPFTNIKARKSRLPFQNIFFHKKGNKKSEWCFLCWPSIGRTSVSCAQEISDVKHHQLVFQAEKAPICWHKSWKIRFNFFILRIISHRVHFLLWTQILDSWLKLVEVLKNIWTRKLFQPFFLSVISSLKSKSNLNLKVSNNFKQEQTQFNHIIQPRPQDFTHRSHVHDHW